MTEQEWNECTDPRRMLNAITNRVSLRKLRLFGVACCRLIWHLLPDERSRRAVETAEALADGLVTEAEAEAAGNAAAEVNGHEMEGIAEAIGWRATNAAAFLLPLPEEMWQLISVWEYVAVAMEGEAIVREGGSPEMLDTWSDQSVESGRTMGWTSIDPDEDLARVIREVMGPSPLPPAKPNPAWLTTSVVALAHAAYDDREVPSGRLNLGRLAVLADALEEADCTDTDLLSHLRGPGPHMRGCHGIDALLGTK